MCSEGYCVSKRCGENQFLDIIYQCVPCSDLARHQSTQSNCTSSCSETREFVDNQYCDLICLSDYFKDDDGNCVSCNTPEAVNATSCGSCTNRVMDNNQCTMSTCPVGTSFLVTGVTQYSSVAVGQCALCNTVYAEITTEDMCTTCGNQRTWMPNALSDGKNRCVWNGALGYFQNINYNWTLLIAKVVGRK
ncbi:MAG: hypothetical protein J6Y85_04195 [Alphaproteobacteria bacterium]|nr:hypothetical protein [Alphaproteobacteria bacterium]